MRSKDFTWTGLFLVTGFCFFGFSVLLRFIGGAHIGLFTGIAIAAITLGVFHGVAILLFSDDKKKPVSSRCH